LEEHTEEEPPHAFHEIAGEDIQDAHEDQKNPNPEPTLEDTRVARRRFFFVRPASGPEHSPAVQGKGGDQIESGKDAVDKGKVAQDPACGVGEASLFSLLFPLRRPSDDAPGHMKEKSFTQSPYFNGHLLSIGC
jgi:hypothetical protein